MNAFRPDILFLLWATGCCCCGTAETENVLAVPSTVDEARTWNAPPVTTVTVTRETRASGGGACGHSPVCLLFVPVMMWEAAFPPEVDVIDIVETGGLNGDATVHGEWKPDGDLLWAERREGGVARAARLLDLPELGRRMVIEGGRAPITTDGTAGVFTPTLVQSQVDLVGAYDHALEHQSGGHGDLLTEAVGALGVESLPLLASWLPRPDESSAREAVLSLACGRTPEGDALVLRQTVLRVIAPVAEAEISARGATCALETPGATEAPQFVSHLVERVCSDASTSRTDDLAQLVDTEAGRVLVDAAIPSCGTATRRTLMTRASKGVVSTEELRAVLDTDHDAAPVLVSYLDACLPDERAVLFEHLADNDEVGPTVDRLALEETLTPSAAEADLLVRAYLHYKPSLLGRRDPQAKLLELLVRTPPAERGPARARLAAITDEKLRVERDTARLVLGDRAVGPSLAAGLRGVECPSGSLLTGENELTAYALLLSGCSCEELSLCEQGKAAEVGVGCAGR